VKWSIGRLNWMASTSPVTDTDLSDIEIGIISRVEAVTRAATLTLTANRRPQ
jgi:hypothetical protein